MNAKKYEGVEKRIHQRYSAPNLRVILKDDKNFRGEKIRDISLGGIFVRMEEPLPAGTEVTLTLDPKLGMGDIKIEGVVIWVSHGDNIADRGVGIRFKEVPERIEEKLNQLFKTLKKA